MNRPNRKPWLLAFILTLVIAVSGWAQNAKVTVSLQPTSLKSLFAAIERQTDYRFSYDSEIGKRQIPTRINKSGAAVSSILKEVLPDMGLEYSMLSDKVITVSRKSGSNATGKATGKAIKVSGTVTDANGEPLTGATISVVGTHTASVADIDGRFSLQADPGQTLKVSLVGMTPVKVKVKQGQTDYPVVLSGSDRSLDEVVVIGYGTLEKKQVTSSITSIKGEDLMQGLGGATIASALQGKIAGMTQTGSASPNSSDGFQLRGVASVNAGKSPLVVIDGIPGGDIRSLNQEDIESIDVLKDASAGAIYGTRAAAGVILVTTKRSQAGKVSVSYRMELSTETLRKKPKLMNAQEYLDNNLGEDYGYDTNWYDAMIRDTPLSNRHVVTITGGSENAQIYSSISYSEQKGILVGDGRRDYSGRINAQFKMFDGRLTINTKLLARQANRDNRIGDSHMLEAMRMNPTQPMMDPENPDKYNVEGPGMGSQYWNPLADVMNRDYAGHDQWLTGTIGLKYRVWDNLFVNASANIDRRQWWTNNYYNYDSRQSLTDNKTGKASHGFSMGNYLSYEAYASYIKEFGFDNRNRIDAVAGWSFWQHSGESFSMSNANFPVDGIGQWDMGSGTDLVAGLASMSSSKDTRERLLALFARVNYSYDNRYLLTASVRRESSSKFGPKHRWGTFWAVSGGWRISNESFMEGAREWLSDLKVRVAYGVTGNNSFDSGNTVRRYGPNSYWQNTDGIWQPAYGPINNANPDLKWEEKGEFNVGLDFAFFNNRLYGKFDWYKRRVKDMLFSVDAPQPPNVNNKIMDNIGTLQNTGFEIEIGGVIMQNRNFQWNSEIRLSHNETKIKNLSTIGAGAKLEGQKFPTPGSPGNGVQLTDGSKIGQFWVYKFAGIDENGKFLIYDKEGEVVPASANLKTENRYQVGNALPAVIASWDHNFRFKDFDFGLQLRSWIDHDVYCLPEMYSGMRNGSGFNMLSDLYEGNKHIDDNYFITDYFIHDGTFFSIDAITAGYTLNLSKWQKYIKKARFYVTVRDVARFTKYKGLNPEVSINGLYPGFETIDSRATLYPQTTRWTFGIQLTF